MQATNKTEKPLRLQDKETFDEIDKSLLQEPNGPLLNPLEPYGNLSNSREPQRNPKDPTLNE